MCGNEAGPTVVTSAHGDDSRGALGASERAGRACLQSGANALGLGGVVSAAGQEVEKGHWEVARVVVEAKRA